jgi:transposase
MTETFRSLIEQYKFLSEQISKQTKLLKALAARAEYKERVGIITSIPGVGLITAMEILLELQDVARFRRADQLAAYVGLTPRSIRVAITHGWDASRASAKQFTRNISGSGVAHD